MATQQATADTLDEKLLLNTLVAVKKGDFSVRLPADWTGIAGRISDTLNDIIERNEKMAHELERVSTVVGKQGKTKERASLGSVSGSWATGIDAVNTLIADLVQPTSEMARVIGAVANGDLSQTVALDSDDRPLAGEFLRTARTVNTMVAQLSSFASEVTRVAREVGTEGNLGGQAQVKGVSGTWKDLTDNVNSMASNLTSQVRNIAAVTTAVANGDLSKKITVDVRGEILELKDTINTMVDQLRSFASEVTRVAREVGTEGKLGGQAQVRDVAGTWKDLTDNVNSMAGSLTSQVRDIAQVTTAVANGDLSKKITVDVQGEMLDLKDTINTMVDQLRSFASEVTRVAREVGTEGNLGGQAEVKGVAGTWKDLTDSVNFMAGSLTSQVRDIAQVTTAVANGDLSKKITVDVQGEILDLKNTINTMVDQLRSFASEVTRVAREVGTEGNLGGQAEVKGVAGTWKDLTDSVNSMASNLTSQVRNIADVTTAVANGDLSRKITVDVQGEILELKDTINTMVDQLNSFASEVTRVAREVGADGKLGGQAQVRDVAGTWKDLTDSVNFMAGSLTSQVRDIAQVTTAVANGDLSKKITVDVRGEILELKDTINTMVDQLSSFASEVTRVAREVGTEGNLGGQAQVKGVSGTWKDLTDNVNSMAGNLTGQVRNIADVTTAVANGDLSKKITVDVQGEILELKNTINIMVDQLSSFASEVTRVAREVGTEGKLGGQAQVKDVAGTWKDLTDNVNSMASNLTGQVRGIAKVVTAVANGDLNQKLTVEAKGEIAALADTINGMIDTLATFADQVTTVAREVGVEGRLGGQASVPGAAGTWKDLTDNVNQLAANLTTQVRAIAEVATAVTEGDLTRSIRVEAEGEVLKLKDNINQMISNLRETTQKNSEQDWLKTNLARFSRMLQGQKDLLTVARLILSELAPLVSASHGVFYSMDTAQDDDPMLRLLASYAYRERKSVSNTFRLGESLVGQSALEKERILLTNVPPEYIQINSGLGAAQPYNIIVLPVVFEDQVKAVIELASFERFSPTHQVFLDQLTESIGIVLNTIEANMRTESLLTQSQSLATELQSQQEELQQTNEELADKAQLLAEQNAEVERKNREVEQAKGELEEKASQLAITSKYKSEFLANMSHELRTPLNSLLILSQQLVENPDGNLSAKQVEYARTIQSSGGDLLTLINDILDLTKIESGTVTLEVAELEFAEIRQYVGRAFSYLAESKKLDFEVTLAPDLPKALHTDITRLQQVLKNLISNAIKFTEKGSVKLEIAPVTSGWGHDQEALSRAEKVIAFSVSDTGIGIPNDKQRLIFEAFQQADGTTSRKYGGTGLGLSISREIARLLGGEIRLASTPGVGSTFTLFVPLTTQWSVVSDQWSGDGTPSEEAAGNGRELAMSRTQRSSALSTQHSALSTQRSSVLSPQSSVLEDDRDRIGARDQLLLIVEDDANFASVLLDRAREIGFKGIVATSADAALSLVREFKPHAVTLDLHLREGEGWDVLEQLKDDPDTRHIPVHIVTVEEQRERGLMQGALAYLVKPVTKEALDAALGDLKRFIKRRVKKLLVVEDNQTQRESIIELIGNGEVKTTAVATGAEALAALKTGRFDCMVLDLGLSDMTGFELIEEIKKVPKLRELPIIVYTGKELTKKEETQLKRVAESIIIKGVQSPERLLDETSLFLHRVAANLPAVQRKMLDDLHPHPAHPERNGESDSPDLSSKKVLIVDDDIRNLFAMTSVLERFNMEVATAENGKDAISILKQRRDIDIVLMDIMMPEMDGFSTLRAIRKIERLRSLPIIVVTAKAMKGDREKCLEAGASDYISKPLDPNDLMSMIGKWIEASQF